MVCILVEEGVVVVNELIYKGMKFDKNSDGMLYFGKEGVYCMNCILYVGGDVIG